MWIITTTYYIGTGEIIDINSEYLGCFPNSNCLPNSIYDDYGGGGGVGGNVDEEVSVFKEVLFHKYRDGSYILGIGATCTLHGFRNTSNPLSSTFTGITPGIAIFTFPKSATSGEWYNNEFTNLSNSITGSFNTNSATLNAVIHLKFPHKPEDEQNHLFHGSKTFYPADL